MKSCRTVDGGQWTIVRCCPDEPVVVDEWRVAGGELRKASVRASASSAVKSCGTVDAGRSTVVKRCTDKPAVFDERRAAGGELRTASLRASASSA